MKKLLIISLALVILFMGGCGSEATKEVPTDIPGADYDNVIPESETKPAQETENTTPATFTIHDLSISPAEINTGERITISVLVTNNGDLAGNYKVVFKIDNLTEETVNVPVPSGNTVETALAFNVYGYAAGTHSVDANGLLGTFTIKTKAVPLPGQDNWYTIRVTGNPLTETETEFSGSYMVVTSEGNVTSRSVDGITPAEYRVKGMIVSCVFQNQNDYGLLEVEILYKDTVVNSSYTIAAYGVVSVATN